jgi:hypothetical protein
VRRLGDRSARQVRGGDVLPDDRGPLAFGGGEPGEQAVGDLLGVIELPGMQVGGDAEGLEPVLVQEPGPDPVLFGVGDGEGVLGLLPGPQRLGRVPDQRALLGVPGRDPGGGGR